MRELWINILAESENSIIGKIIPFIFVLIWVISGIVGTVTKKKRQEEIRRRAEEASRNAPIDFDRDLPILPRAETSSLPPPLPPHPIERHRSAERDPVREMPRKTPPPIKEGGRSNEAALRRQRMQEKIERTEKNRRAEVAKRAENARRLQAMSDAPVTSPIFAESGAKPAVRPIEVEASTTATRNARSTGTTAAALARWLQPQTLRGQFILTEVFQPPVTLRQERDQMSNP